MPPNRNPSYRADIDGLRALAILPVLLYHARLGCPGGYVGVDIFFVISGYLITSLILKEQAAGVFSLADFWERRVRRIFPAMALMLAGTFLLGWFIY
ncbi:MAG: acyltransferase family protein, partial [Limisphaerales bacterium]